MKLIRKRLTLNPTLVELVGERIFYQKVPYDSDAAQNYPLIILNAERFTDAIHGVSGTLTVEIITSQQTIAPEVIERLVRQSLEGVFFNGDEIFLLKWQKSEPFSEPAAERLALIVGVEMTFEIREFPNAETSTPDAVQALNDWAEVFVITRSPFEEFFIPTAELPAIYFETQQTKMTEQTHSVVWLESIVKAHLFAPTVSARRKWLTVLSGELATIKSVRLRDDTPCRVTDVEVDYSANELDGQLKVTCAYGLPRAEIITTPINHRISEEVFESVSN